VSDDLVSDGWLDGLADVAGVVRRGVPDADEVAVDVVVTGMGGGDRRVRLLVATAGGTAALRGVDLGAPGTAAATFTVPVALVREVVAGTTTPSALTMQGRAKTAGDHRAVLACLRATATPAFAERRAALAAVTPSA
jgi:hypothetical protein